MGNDKILYVEDDKMLGKITSDVLIKTGFSVRWLFEGLKALDAFEKESFDICIIDIMLPGLDGYSLVQAIRKKNPNIPIIFLTARSLVEDVVKGFEVGGNDYLKKPFGIGELIVRINEQLKKKSVNETPNLVKTFSIGKYYFDYSSMQLSIGSKKSSMTYLENELLYLLLSNEILYRQKAQVELWGGEGFFNSRSMDVYISKLRKYLCDDHSISIINIRGLGYKLLIR